MFVITEGYCACKCNYLLYCSILGGKIYRAPSFCPVQRARVQTCTASPTQAKYGTTIKSGQRLTCTVKTKYHYKLLYLDASTLQEILADVSAVVFNRVLVDELLAHNRPFLLKTRRDFSFL